MNQPFSKTIVFITFSLFLFACNFNRMYLHPTKMPSNITKITQASTKDTTLIYFDEKTHQPEFRNEKNELIDLGYTIESVTFQSTNGHYINGWMVKPKNIIPTITLLHFHGNAGCLISQYRSMTPLVSYGFQIFLFDYSGFGFSEGRATRENVYKDADAALNYIKYDREDVKGTKLVIYGHSLGGHLAAVIASERQKDIDGLVIEGAFSSHKDIAARSAGIFGRILVRERYSAIKSIRTYKKPLLVIHSTEDQTIPFEMGKKIFARANTSKTFYEIKKCHICGPTYYAAEIAQKIKEMLKSE